MSNLPQSGDIDIHFVRKNTWFDAVFGIAVVFFDAFYRDPYRKWPNYRRVVRVTWLKYRK